MSEEAKKYECKYFGNIIGLDRTKRKLEFYLESYHKNGVFPPIIFTGQKGIGKSLIANSLGDELGKPFLEVNCSSIRSLNEFWDQIAIPHLSPGGPITLFMDECSDLPRSLEMALLTILNPNSTNMNNFTHRGQSLMFDLRNISWVFATTNPEKVQTALMDRLEKVEIDNYNNSELGKILLRNLGALSEYKHNIDSDIINLVASVVRGNARSAVKLAKSINFYLTNKGKPWFTLHDWNELKEILHIRPLGISNIELRIMRTLEHGPCTLNHLAAKLGSPKTAIQNTYESFLLKNNLIKIGQNGRELTGAGYKYLKELE